jgi:ketosteroid isomerase-like protein
MSLTTTLIAIIALGLSAMAFAQEQPPTPAEEQPSTTVQETATTTPSVETTPAAEMKPTPPAAMSPAAKPEKMASPAAKAASPAAMPAMGGKKMNVEAALKDNENRWEASFATHDPSVAQSLVANDFVGVYWDGKVLNKSGVISQIKKDKDTYKSTANEKLAVHMFGKNVAVVVGTAREKGTAKDGKAFDRQFRFTDTWVERNGQWQCVASQVIKTKG